MNHGGTAAVPGGTATMELAFHSSSLPDGSYGGNPAGWLLDVGGKRIYIAGDTGVFSDMERIGRPARRPRPRPGDPADRRRVHDGAGELARGDRAAEAPGRAALPLRHLAPDRAGRRGLGGAGPPRRARRAARAHPRRHAHPRVTPRSREPGHAVTGSATASNGSSGRNTTRRRVGSRRACPRRLRPVPGRVSVAPAYTPLDAAHASAGGTATSIVSSTTRTGKTCHLELLVVAPGAVAGPEPPGVPRAGDDAVHEGARAERGAHVGAEVVDGVVGRAVEEARPRAGRPPRRCGLRRPGMSPARATGVKAGCRRGFAPAVMPGRCTIRGMKHRTSLRPDPIARARRRWHGHQQPA